MINHPELEAFKNEGGLFNVEPCEMDLNIGRKGKIVNPGRYAWTGMIHNEVFEIIGVQRDYRGNKCYRVVADTSAYQGVLFDSEFGYILPHGTKFEFVS